MVEKKSTWQKINDGADKVNKVLGPATDATTKFINASSKAFNKGAKKTTEGLNEASGRAIGQKTVKCPRCKSTNLQFAGNYRKGFSVGKAIGGTILAGGTGSIAGFAGKKGKKNHWHCADCGKTFKK